MSNSFAANCPFLRQAKHNEKFHSSTCEYFPDDFYDWKITTLFYTAIHYVKALSNQNGISIGEDHYQIRNNIKPPDRTGRKPSMAFSKSAWGYYDYLYRVSQISRYNGFVDKTGIFTDNESFQLIMCDEHNKCIEALEKLKRYIFDNRGLRED